MLARLVLWLCRVFPILSADWRQRRVRRVQFCPACMNRVRVSIRFDAGSRAIVCQCPDCLACWSYNPAVRPEKWAELPKVTE